MKTRMRTRILALLLSMAMVMNGGISALASEAAPVANEETGHKHTAECYVEEKTATCGLEQSEGHSHGEGCYTTTITCGQEEFEGHSHTDDCYTTTVSTCEKDEHTHGEGCNSEESPCGIEEHTHDDGCTTETTKLTCGQEEVTGHTHDDSCKITELTCGQEEVTGHTHSDACYTTTSTLVCTIPETEVNPIQEDLELCEVCGLEECTCEKEVVVCEACGLEECTCEKEVVVCEVCGLEECTCEKEVVVCEVCGLEECACEKETTGCICGDEACECENCEEGCTCTSVEEFVESVEFEDEDIKVTVTALEEGAIPEGAILKVTPIEKKEVTDGMSEEEKIEVEEINAEYALTEEKLEEKMQDEEETEIAGFLVYDITFVKEDGTEIEPKGEVKVELKLNKVLPEEVKESKLEVQDVTIIHLEEDENGEVKDVVDMKSESEQLENISTTSENAVETAEFKTASFSKFVITWVGTTITLDAMCVDSAGHELEVFESDKNGQNPVKVDVIRRVLASSDKDLSALNIYIQGYEYSGAYIKIGDQPIIENVQQISYDENDGWKYKVSGQAEKDLLGSGTLYLKYATLDGTAASKINTIGSEDGIILNLYNYTSAVNSGKTFVFRGSGGQDGSYSPAADNPLGVDGYKPGILNRRLDNSGNPVLSGNGESLGYLFNSNTSGVEAYTGLSGLFRKASGGWYVYDSGENHAQLNTKTNSIDVYDATLFPYNTTDAALLDVGGFLPFNELPENAVKNEKYCLTKTEGNEETFPDYWLGLNLVTDFEQPENGQVNGQEMIFSFSGDDDMWVFIDGNLVLDIGGTHGPLSGDINFATGKVNVHSRKEAVYGNIAHPTTADGTTPEKYIGELYKEAGMEQTYLDAMFEKEGDIYTTYKANTPHTMKVFYFERATSQSNCKIEFNIQPANFGEVNVEKEITSPSIDLSKFDASVKTKEDVEFKFLAEYTAPGTSEVVKSGIPYVLINADGTIENTKGVTGKNGEFYLKDGQKAKFDKLRVDGTFKVTEVLVPQYGCDEVTVTTSGETPITNTKKFMKETIDGVTKEYYTTTENGKPDEKIEIEKITDNNLSSELVVVENEAHTVEFKNSADLKGHLVIRKDLRRYNETFGEATFVFKVDAKVDANTVYSDVVAISFTEPGVKEHRIDGLPAGAVVTVEEVYEGASYKKVGSYVIPDATEGTIVIPADCNVEADKAIEVVFGFINDYVDGRLNSGSGLVNEFIYKEDEQKWVSPQQVAALPNTELLGKKPEEDSGEIDS